LCTFNNGGINTAERLQYVINSTGDACFGQCDVYDAAYDFFLNSDPALLRDFQGYNINEHGTSSLYSDEGFVAYLKRSDVKTAIHAPASVAFQTCNFTLNGLLRGPTMEVIPPAYDVVPTLLGNGIKVNIFSGKLDYVLPYLGNEVVIQNMTWNGQQGFSNPPTVPLLNQYGQTVGSGREERGLSYYAIEDAGHRVAQDAPAAALVWLKEVVVRCDDDWWWWRSKRA
jgi:carboxypeptidase D